MGHDRSETWTVSRVSPSGVRREPDELVVEEPLTVHLDGVQVATTMRTPGHDDELAAGFCHSEGLLGDAVITAVVLRRAGSAPSSDLNVAMVDTGGRAPEPAPRSDVISSSCGLCGAEQIDTLASRLAALDTSTGPSFPLDVLAAVPDRVLPEQVVFAATGAVHAAAAFTPDGEVVLVREDVGRHNAVDKVVGRLLLDGRLPASGLGLFVSGRASFEMVAKAWSAGFPCVVAVSAPTALATATARRANVALVGFTRGDRINVYAPEWVGGGAVGGPVGTTGLADNLTP